MVKFSIIVPVYNVEKYLRECIDSLVKQTYLPYEIILIDDGSKDDSGHICDDYFNKYSDLIKVVHKENEGALIARELGISIASGDYFVFVDSDDYLRRDALEVVAKEIEKNNSDCVIIGLCRFNGNEIINCYNEQQKDNYIIENKKELYKLIFNSQSYNSMCRKIVKSSLFNVEMVRFDRRITHGEDLLRSLPLLKKIKKTSILNDCLYYYRENPNSVTHSVRYDNYKYEYYYVSEIVLEFLISENIFIEEDYNAHRNIIIMSTVSTLLSITQKDICVREKKKIFKELRNSNYFLTFLSKQKLSKIYNKKDKIVYFLFKSRMYRLIILLNKVYNKCKTRKAKSNEN